MTDDRVTRRRLLERGAAVGAGAVLAGAPGVAAEARRRRHRHRHRRHVDVAIVGAGFAGLTAALQLVKAGRSVVVLEARNRIGGRAFNLELGGGEISERGATFAGPTQNHILALAKEFGVGTFPTYDEGDNVYYADGSRSTYSDTGPLGTAPPDPLILPDLVQVILRLDQMSTEVPVDAPWSAAQAGDWDGQTLDSWVRANSVLPRFRRIVPAATRPIFGAEPRELSLLFTLFYIAASGDEQHPGTFERNFNTRNGAQMLRFEGGTQRITLNMAEELGKRVVLRSPVRRIVQHPHHVHIHSRRLRVKAKRVIVAVPPTLAGRIKYDPALPDAHAQLFQRLPQGHLIKVAAVYDQPFWRDAGLTGTAVSLNGPVNATFDDSPEDGSLGVIFGFVGGDEARRFAPMSAADRRAAVLKNYVAYFGQKAASPREYFESDWRQEKWTRGCPVAIAGPGTLTAFGPQLRKPEGRIHWAGTETSTYWNGYMDGAVRSGKRTAQEILAEL
jgi:monoamine oxidase